MPTTIHQLNLTWSPEHLKITQTLLKGGKILDIPLQDHKIISAVGDYLSFREEGFISRERPINKNDAELILILHKQRAALRAIPLRFQRYLEMQIVPPLLNSQDDSFTHL